MKVRDIIRRLKDDGWNQVRTGGDHRNFRKEGNPYVVTVPGHERDDVTPGVLSDIRRKTGLPLR
ncbi:MAG: type II toxin-antitoxin system HicA family toxin [Armatimonadota bacterium]|nr:type II toxin-antitoxin system HicA family toxin [Armatimonadota bacterium]